MYISFYLSLSPHPSLSLPTCLNHSLCLSLLLSLFTSLNCTTWRSTLLLVFLSIFLYVSLIFVLLLLPFQFPSLHLPIVLCMFLSLFCCWLSFLVVFPVTCAKYYPWANKCEHVFFKISICILLLLFSTWWIFRRSLITAFSALTYFRNWPWVL